MSTTAVMLLKNQNPDWPFIQVAGLPLVERNLMGLKSVGVRMVHLLCGAAEHDAVKAHFARTEDQRLPQIRIYAPGEESQLELPDRFLVLDGRRVFHRGLFMDAVDREETVSYVDADGGSAGICVSQMGLSLDFTLFDSLKSMKMPAGTFSQRADAPGDAQRVKKLVFKSLIKSTDGWFSVNLNRPVSMSISKILVRYPVHPNVATVFTFLVGVASGILPALGTYLGFALGGVLYQLASILDGVDGELARVKFQGSRTGEWLDTIGDDLTNVFYLAGVTIGVYRSMGPHVLVWLGAAAVLVFMISHGIMYWLLAVRFDSGDMFGFQWEIKEPGKKSRFNRILLALEPFTRRDCYAFMFMVFALASVAWVALPTALVFITGTLIVMLTQMARHRKKATKSAVSG